MKGLFHLAWHRLKLAWHVLRGRPLIWGVHLRPPQGGFIRFEPDENPHLRIQDCHFDGR